MAEYIDLDTPLELKAAWGNTYKPYTSTLRELLDVNRIPYTAADVRPVVLCKDCVHFIRGKLFGDMVCDYHYLHQYHAEPNEFCSHAEKREES